MSYRETLYRWAAEQVPAQSWIFDFGTEHQGRLHELETVTSVDVNNDPGYSHSSYTFEDPHVDVTIHFLCKCGHQFHYEADIESMGALLTDLFAIEETP